VLALLASGCSTTPSVQTDYNNAYDFSRARSFAIVEPATVSNSLSMASNDILHNRISGAIRAALTARAASVRRARAGRHAGELSLPPRTRPRSEYNTGFAYQRCWRCGPYLGHHDRRGPVHGGHAVRGFHRPEEQGNAQWRGTVSKRLSKSRTMEERKQMVDEIVNVIAKFLPGP
jgi:hypothetical protein